MGSFRKSGRGLLSRWLGQAWDSVKNTFAMPPDMGPRRLKAVQQLEERYLLSATPVAAAFKVNLKTPQQTFPQTPQAVAVNLTTADHQLHVAAASAPIAVNQPAAASLLTTHNSSQLARHELVIIDPATQDYQQLVNDIQHNQSPARQLDVVVLDAGKNGIEQVSNVLAGYHNLDAIHVISHGTDGAVKLGTQWLDQQELTTYEQNVRGWGAALKANGDILFYGCDVAGNEAGRQFLERIHQLTGADVAANTRDTGAAQLGGDWNLNYTVGPVHTAVATSLGEQQSWIHLLAPITVTNTNDSGPGSLRQAILTANATPGLDTIVFNVGSGVQTIKPTSALPPVTDAVIIDGTTQPGYSGKPIIVLDGSLAGAGANGLTITAGNSTVRGLVINNFSGNGIELDANGNNVLGGNYIGTDVTGAVARPNGGYGVEMTSGLSNTIGGTAVGAGNVISGNAKGGIRITGSSFLVSEDNHIVRVDAQTGAVLATYPTGVAGDSVVVGADGSMYVADYYNNKVLYFDANGAPLASFGAGHLNEPQDMVFGPDGNLYVGNAFDGSVKKFSPAGTFLGTFIPAGSGGISNAKGMVFGPNGDLYVADYSSSNVLRYNGTTGAFLGVFAASSGGIEDLTFGPDGNLYVSSYGDNTIYRYRGTDGSSLGAFVTGNDVTPYGLRFDSAGNLDVVCESPGVIRTYDGTTGAFLHNLVTGLSNPYWFTTTPSASGGDVIQGNTIGVNAGGSAALPNLVGVVVDANNATIGGTAPGAGNTIADNTGKGVIIAGGSGNAVEGNVIFGNGGLGIDLGNDGVTANTGTKNLGLPNSGMNYPVFTFENVGGTTLTVSGYVGTAPGQATFAGARVEIFKATNDPSGHGQSQTYLGFLTADANGNFYGSLTVSGLNPGDKITATATDAANNTSEFGPNAQVVTGPVIKLDSGAVGSIYNATYHANTPGVAVEDVTHATIIDGASPTLVSLTVQIQNPHDGSNEVLSANTAGTSITASYSGGTLTLSGTDTLADYQQVLRTVTYQDRNASPNTSAVRNVFFVANDGTDDSNVATTHVTVSTAALLASSTTVVSSHNPSVYGQAVSFTATVTALGIPPLTGSVTFMDGGTNLGTVALSGGTAAFTTSTLSAGSHSITASYGGNLVYASSTSSILTQTITPAALTVMANNAGKTYGQANPAFTDTITGFVNGDTASVVGGHASLTTTATASSGVGTYTIAAGPGSLSAANYTFAFANGTLTVTPATLTVTANNASKVYGQANPVFTDTLTGFVNGDTAGVVSGAASLSTTATPGSGVGSYTITAAGGTLSAANYTFAFAGGTLTVTPATLTVTANNASKVYGQANPAFTDTLTGFVNGDTAGVVSGSANLTTTATASSGVGSYTITAARGTLNAANYTFAFAGGTLTVTPATLTVTANNAGKVYGQANPALTDTISGFVNGDTASVVGGAASLSTTATTGSGVGTYTITAARGTLNAANYTFSFAGGTLTVSPAPLTVTAINASKVQGQPNPAFAASYNGFVNGDTAPSLGGTLTFSTPATASSPVGSYAVTPSGLSSANYTISFVSGTLTVTPASASASSTSVVSSGNPSVYGQAVIFTVTVSAVAPATGTPTGTVSVMDGATLLGTATLGGGTAAVTTSALAAGSHNITAGYHGDATFAASTSAALTQTVTPAPLTVTAHDASKVYGQANPAFSASYSGFVNGDSAGTLGGTLSFATPATAASPVGGYAITPGGLNSNNYSITFASGTLTVTPATLTVTANDASSVYGHAIPAFTGTFTGFVNGDTSSVVSGSAGLTTTATAASGVGTYAITAAAGTLGAANYTFRFADGELTVTPANLTVTANDKSMIYGGSVSALDATFTGLVNGDTSAVVSGLNLSTTATSRSNVGTYTISVTGGTAANYTITDVNGTLTVGKAALAISADNERMTYGGAVPALDATFTGLVNGDTSAVVFGLDLSTTATSRSNVGAYTIRATGGTAANYTIADVNGTLTVDKAALIITANNERMIYGGSVPFLDPTITGLVNGDRASVVSGLNLSTTATSSSNVGTYIIKATGGTAANYTITDVNGTLTVEPETLQVTANDVRRLVGQANPPFSATLTGFVNGDTAAVVSGSASLTTTATAASDVGTYAITADPGSLSAANYTFTFDNGTLTVTSPNPPMPAPVPPAPSTDHVISLPAPPVLPAPSHPVAASREIRSTTPASPVTPIAVVTLSVNSRSLDASAGQSLNPAVGPNSGGGADIPTVRYIPSYPAFYRNLPSDGPNEVFVPPPLPAPDPFPLATVDRPATVRETPLTSELSTDFLWAALDQMEESGTVQDSTEQFSTVLGTGLIASAGYVLLNTRTGFWLLSLMAARPLWKQFDPLEILYAWEEEDKESGETREETLLSLVD
jgi:hypothetical protein